VTEYTSLEVSKRLAEAGFKAEPDAYLPIGYRADTLLAWLLNVPLFSKRPWSIHIAVVAEMAEDGTWKRKYRVAAGCGDGGEICTFASALPDALGEVVIKVREADDGKQN
jgi:hypothetical protein